MNALNHGLSAVFDVLFAPLERLGRGPALVIASGIFGIVALVLFKHLSWQRGIRAAKDKVKARANVPRAKANISTVNNVKVKVRAEAVAVVLGNIASHIWRHRLKLKKKNISQSS